MPTRGMIELFLRDIPATRIARKGGFDHSYVSRCLNGKQRPSERLKKAATAATGISAEILFEEVRASE